VGLLVLEKLHSHTLAHYKLDTILLKLMEVLLGQKTILKRLWYYYYLVIIFYLLNRVTLSHTNLYS